MRPFFVVLSSTFFGVGYTPLVPGTAGSLAGLALWLLVRNNIPGQLIISAALVVVGFMVCGRMEKLLAKKDPGVVVIDEVLGMFITLCAIPFSIPTVILGFLLFRILDTLKPFPAGKIQDAHGSLGIMGDDIVAACYANIILNLVLVFSR